MIDNSVPWKEQLLRAANSLERRKRQRRWTERTSFLLERDIMVGMYAVRKLHESRKVSDRLASSKWAVVRHSLIGHPPDIWDRIEPWKHYNLESSEEIELGLIEICNQVIHSWVWMTSATEDVFDGIYVSSDRHRRRCLYFFSVDELVSLFRSTGKDNIVTITMKRDHNGEMQYTRLAASTDSQPLVPPVGK